MDIYFLFLPLFVTFLLLTDFKNPANGWGSLALSFASLGGLYSAADRFSARILKKLANPDSIRWINNILVNVFVKTPLCLFPVAMLLFAVHYSHWNKNRVRPIKPLIIPVLLIPAVVMYFVPLNPKDYLSLRQFLIITDLWTFPYITMVYIFLYKSLVSGNQRFEADRPLTIITIVGISAIYVIAVYLLPFYHFPIFMFNPYLVIIFLGLFSFLALKYGFLGFKLSVRNLYIDNAIKTVDSEVSVLNCHIKDKIVRITACARDIDAAIGDDRNLIVKKIETILAVTDQVSTVVEQLHHYLDRIHLDPIRQNIVAVVKQAIALFEPRIKEKRLRIDNNLPRDLIIQVDRFYLSEVLKKILQNSMEAMATGGSIIIDVARSKRNIVLIINDNGCGISSKDLPHILKPFFTTKDPSSHFGLGLPYSYNIMRQHGGLLEIESVENNGTTVFLNFPADNVLPCSFGRKGLRLRRLRKLDNN